MTIINRKQFETHYLPHVDSAGDILVWQSPHLSYMLKQYGFTCDKYPTDKYDLVVVDAPDYVDCPGVKSKHEKKWIDSAIVWVKDGGQFILRLGGKSCQYLSSYSYLNIKEIVMDGQNTIIRGVYDKNYTSTQITYPDKTIDQNIFETPILSYYDEDHLNILKGQPISDEQVVQLRHNFTGKNGGTLIDSYQHSMSHIDHNNVLMITDGGPWRTPWKLEENPNIQTGGRAIILSSPEEVEQVRSYLKTPVVMNFIRNVTFDKTHGLPVSIKKILTNPLNLV